MSFLTGVPDTNHPRLVRIAQDRAALVAREKSYRSDHSFRASLSPVAQEACAIVTQIRAEESATVWRTTNDQAMFPGIQFNTAKTIMESTKLWQILKKLPKGSLLHAHIAAMVDLEWVFHKTINTPGMSFMADRPLNDPSTRQKAVVKFIYNGCGEETEKERSVWACDYEPHTGVHAARAALSYPEGGREGFVKWLVSRCSISHEESLQHHLGVDDIWGKFQYACQMSNSAIFYEPIFRAYLQEMFQSLVNDGIKWVELRVVFHLDYRASGCSEPDPNRCEIAKVIAEEVRKFKDCHQRGTFWGCKVIWCALRSLPTRTIIQDMEDCIKCKKLFPSLIGGYDVVGQETLGRTLKDLTPEFIWFQERCTEENVSIPFILHAGECLGDGDSTDENLFDAILLGARRIGHGFSLYKHPVLIDMVKEKRILIETCPISNEILRLTPSILHHPLPALLARGVAASLCNDDPSILGHETSGMTHDFWQALQGWENLGLEGLGSLAQNSVRFSIFGDQTAEEWSEDIEAGEQGTGKRARLMKRWRNDWEEFCLWVVEEYGNSSPNGRPRSGIK